MVISIKRLYWISSCILVGIMLSACSDDGLLSERPKHTEGQYAFHQKDSNLIVGLDIPFESIRAIVEKSIDKFRNVPIDGSIDCSFTRHIPPLNFLEIRLVAV